MEIYKLQQLCVLLLCTSAGFVCGVTFDVFKILRKELNATAVMSCAIDIIFWVVCTVIVYLTIYYSNNADIRWFEFLGLTAGFIMYILTIHKFAFGMIYKLVVIMLKSFSLVCIPFKLLHKLIVPVKNLLFYLKSRAFFIFHKTFTVIFDKAKKFFSKKGKNEI